jgi:hypothetical protein
MVLTTLLLAQASVAPYFDRSVSALTSLGSFSARIEGVATSAKRRQRATYGISVTRQAVFLRIQEPPQMGLDKTDRTFFLTGNQLTGYDAVANERLLRKVPAKGALGLRLVETLGGVDDAVRLTLSPAALGTFYAGYRTTSGWTTTRRGNIVQISRRPNPTSRSTFAFDQSTGLLRRLTLANNGAELSWTITYGPLTKALTFATPANARTVTSFTVQPGLPSFSNLATEQVVRAALRAQKGFQQGVITVVSGGRRSQLFLGDRKAGERRSDLQWAFDGKILAMRDPRSRRFWRGPAKRQDITDTIDAAVKSGVDPMLRRVLARQVPFQDLLSSDMKARVVGSVAPNGVPCDIVEFRNPVRRVALFVRKDNRLIASASTDLLDRAGNRVSTTTRTFGYSRSLPPDAFSLTPQRGEAVRPLPKIRIRLR